MKKQLTIAALIGAGILGGQAQAADPVPTSPLCTYIINMDAGTVDGMNFEGAKCVPAGKPVPISERQCQNAIYPDLKGTEKYFVGLLVGEVMVTPCNLTGADLAKWNEREAARRQNMR